MAIDLPVRFVLSTSPDWNAKSPRVPRDYTRAVPEEFVWDVQVPGEDLPQRLTTDYLLGDGEQISIDGRPWLVERVEVEPSDERPGLVFVIPPQEI